MLLLKLGCTKLHVELVPFNIANALFHIGEFQNATFFSIKKSLKRLIQAVEW